MSAGQLKETFKDSLREHARMIRDGEPIEARLESEQKEIEDKLNLLDRYMHFIKEYQCICLSAKNGRGPTDEQWDGIIKCIDMPSNWM